MKNILILLGIILVIPAQAEESEFCRNMCSSEKKECRNQALENTKYDTDPPVQSAPRSTSPGSGFYQNEESVNFQNRRMERMHACEDHYFKCTNACTRDASLNTKSKANNR